MNIAKGRCSEVRSMIYLCEDFKYCSMEERIELQRQIKQISTGIVNLNEKIKYSQNRKAAGL